LQVIPHSLGKSEVLKGGWEVRVRFPGRAVVFFLFGLTGAMVARLPTEQEVVGSIPTLGLCSRSSVGRSSASHAEGPGFDPLRELGLFRGRSSVQSAQRTFAFVRYGVVGNMSGSHPVASGSIPGIGFGSLSSVGRASA
jgi:hypothetical protein